MTTEFMLRDRWLREKFERKTRTFLATLYHAARRLTAQPADAEDLVHDTYIKAYQAFPTVDLHDDAAWRAWLLCIMTNTFRDRYRRRLRAPEIAGSEYLDEVDGSMLPASEPGPDRRLEHRRFAEAADAAIACLPREVRLVVVLFFIEELSYREIAEIAGCPVGTVMSRLWRGRQYLRQALRAYGEHEPSEALGKPVPACRRSKL